MTAVTSSATAATSTFPPSEPTLRVERISPAASDVVLLRLVAPDGAELAPWRAGDHLELILPSSRVRHYSLCGDVEDRHAYTIAVLRVADGRGGSVEIHDNLRLGLDLMVRGPRSNFGLVDAPSYLLLAGGIGITPLYAMARALHGAGADWSLVYGARSSAAMAFASELAEFAGDRVRFVPQDVSGLPDFAQLLDAMPAGTAVYCCGPEAMIAHVEGLCAERPALSLHVERFGGAVGIVALDGTDQPFELELARTGVVLTVPADRTALEVVHDVLPDHPYSCLGGQCGSCEVAVLAGEVDYRDEVLSDEEHEANSAMMLCVSRARSVRLVIEL